MANEEIKRIVMGFRPIDDAFYEISSFRTPIGTSYNGYPG